MFKVAFIVMAPDGDPAKYHTTITTGKLELHTFVIELMDFDGAVELAKDLVQNKGIQAFHLCPGFTHQAVARIAAAVGGRAAVQVSRGDVPATMMVGDILTKEGWFDE